MITSRNGSAFLVLGAILLAGSALLSAQSSPEKSEGIPRPERASTDYIIGVEDVIEITVWKNPELSLAIPVRPDGKISVPLIDEVVAAGLTPLELKKILTTRWESYLSDPEVSVMIREINSFKIYLLGEVARPGELRLKSKVRLLQAISMVGGFTTYADKNKILLLRAEGSTELRFEINYSKIISGSRPQDNHMLQPGDTIVVQ